MKIFKNLFSRNFDNYSGMYPINIYLLRLVFLLTFVIVGADSWMYIINYEGSWDNLRAVAFCVWAAYSTLSFLGLFHPLKMLPLVLFQIFYKSLWLVVVALPLWSANQLAGSPAEEMTYIFIWVLLPIVAIPWKYVVITYVLPTKKNKITLTGSNIGSETSSSAG